ncbi:energy transducer TonB [Thiobacillus sp.]|uniref:energy transducer TonB n=1 Tax=Thiobacillus sp. TaxID=924 RepID=UPI0017A7F115|nr:energy transducer TonB [Thiobacillus sp.]MBC2732377.1 energy transducer TonB [Thiobacillus sp.]MBC2741115.1 energy transducer TonB [Thiobacillus sp.]MBC2759806.1 energy transducer TonB [Thiobacillus sp.]
MHGRRQKELKARLAGLSVVLALHGALFYSLWHYRVLPPPTEAATLFVDLLTDAPKVELPKPDPPKPKVKPVKREQPVQPPPPQQLAAQTPVVSPSDPVVPPSPPPPPPRIEAPAEPVPPAPPPKPVGPAVLSSELALTCPDRVPPSYPAISRRLGEEGKVVLRVELDETGRVDRTTIKTSSGYARIDEAALAAVKRWRCRPASRDGAAVRAVATQPFNFVLEGR